MLSQSGKIAVLHKCISVRQRNSINIEYRQNKGNIMLLSLCPMKYKLYRTEKKNYCTFSSGSKQQRGSTCCDNLDTN
jgi:hypothetical protein